MERRGFFRRALGVLLTPFAAKAAGPAAALRPVPMKLMRTAAAPLRLAGPCGYQEMGHAVLDGSRVLAGASTRPEGPGPSAAETAAAMESPAPTGPPGVAPSSGVDLEPSPDPGVNRAVIVDPNGVRDADL